jgi:hypothetical protein
MSKIKLGKSKLPKFQEIKAELETDLANLQAEEKRVSGELEKINALIETYEAVEKIGKE